MGATVTGLEPFMDRLDRAGEGLSDLSDLNRQLASDLERAAGALVPRRTGALSASGTPTVTASSWGVSYGRPYALFVHFGTRSMRPRPWLLEARDRTTDTAVDTATRHVQQLLD